MEKFCLVHTFRLVDLINFIIFLNNFNNNLENEDFADFEQEANNVLKLDQWETNAKNSELRDYIEKLKVNLKISCTNNQDDVKIRTPSLNTKNLNLILYDPTFKPSIQKGVLKNRSMVELNIDHLDSSSDSSDDSVSMVKPISKYTPK